MMENHGQIYATDNDARRLAPIHDRLTRAGVRNVQVRTPRARADAVTDLDGKIDCVLVDAPCTGIGTWRRNPDAKWRLRPGSLEVRRKEQAAVLDRAAAAREARRPHRLRHLLGPAGGERRRARSLPAAPGGLRARAAHEEVLADGRARLLSGCRASDGVRPPADARYKTGTDGFYVAVLVRNP